MDETAPQTSGLVRQKSTLGSLATAAVFGALIAVALLYLWGASIAEERGAQILKPSTEQDAR